MAERVVPLLVRYARPVPAAEVVFSYDERRGLNVVEGQVSVPAVLHRAGMSLVKTVQVQEGEDQIPLGR